ncbi:MAG: aminotransferase class III-fold pyridoxal phosphate-dependent enzyme [bacterium]|nr:aminotransferase class III-fold pyridoxal phosphate-dependent enzyme [bacterium]
MKLNEHYFFARDLERDYPLAVRGKGSWVWDEKGKKYLDGCAGANVTGIGHGVVEIADAMADQAKKIAYVPPQHFLNQPTLDFSKKLIEMAPEGYARVMLLSGGSEAIENALKIARQFYVYTGKSAKYRIISRWQGFHGNTLAADSVSGKTDRRTIQMPMLMPVPHIVPACCYRCSFDKSYPGCGVMCAKDLERVIIQEGPEYISAFVSETIVGAAAGAVTPVPEYYPMIREICDKYDILWIADEVMTGVGRTGTFLAIEQWGVTPDLVVLAKGLSSGYAPLAAILIQEKVFNAFSKSKSSYVGGHTYNAHPVTASVGLSVLDYLEKHRIIEGVKDKGRLLGDGLKSIADKISIVGDMRGRGLMWGLEFVKDKKTKLPFDPTLKICMQIVLKAMEKGLLVYPVSGCADGKRGDGVLICPPLTISNEEIDILIQKLEETLSEISKEIGSKE